MFNFIQCTVLLTIRWKEKNVGLKFINRIQEQESFINKSMSKLQVTSALLTFGLDLTS